MSSQKKISEVTEAHFYRDMISSLISVKALNKTVNMMSCLSRTQQTTVVSMSVVEG